MSVSTRYTLCLGGILDACKVLGAPYVGYSAQYLGEVALARAAKHAGEDLTVLGLGAAAVPRRPLLERSHQRFIDVTYDQIRHDTSSVECYQ
jgi:hypothetical protein